jgi:hypothetical protein
MTMKQEIIANESAFQRACSLWVERNIGECVSSLMYPIGQNLEECSRIFDFDYDEAIGWFQKEDYSEVVDNFIDESDLEDLETIADMVGYWSDVIEEVPPLEQSFKEGERVWVVPSLGVCEDSQGDADLAALEASLPQIRTKVKALITNDSEYVEIGQHFNLDPDYNEIYEYWTIPEGWTARDLIDEGQVVFEFAGLRIWGRQTSGQSISIDGVIRRIVKDLDEDHWIWGKV